jgi:hypothetical protein
MKQNRSFVKGSGRITIGKVTSSTEEDYISISLDDAMNHAPLVEIRMTPDAFGRALTGSGWMECDFEFNTDAPLGKRHEHKTEEVSVPYWDGRIDSPERAVLVRKAIAEFEADGWLGHDDDALNHHNRAGGEYGKFEVFRIHFFRYVSPTEAAGNG